MSEHVLDRGTTAPPPTRAPAKRRLSAKRLLLAGAALAAVAGGADFGYHWWTVGRFIETTDDAYVGGNVTPISPRVAGFVQQILVTDNQLVQAGQVLLRLDPADFQAALSHAAAALQAKRAAVVSLQAQRARQQSVIAQAEADALAKQAQAAFAAEDSARYRSLAVTAAGSRQDMQKSLAADRAAQASVQAAVAALAAARQQLAVQDAAIAEAEAALRQAMADEQTARLNLGYTVITAPITGYVGNRSAQVGGYVAAGTDLLSVVPANGLWVDANFKEDQLAAMRPGDPVSVVADVLPGHRFEGHVASLAPATGAVFSVIPPQNATGNFTKIVQRVPVRITLAPDGQTLGLLRAGLSIVASVDTRRDADKETPRGADK